MNMSISVTENVDNIVGMSKYPDKFFDLAICDPPYGIGEDGDRLDRTRKSEKWKNPKPKIYTKKDWDKEPPPPQYFDELFRVSKRQIIWGANHFISLMPYNSASWIVWDKKTSGDFSACELAWCSVGGSVKKFEWLWNGFRKQQPEERFHPTQKPVALYKWVLQNYAKQGYKILDTHLGSGSSRIAAHSLNFDFYGFEIDKEYFETQEQRFNSYLSKPIFDTPTIPVQHPQQLVLV